MPKQKRAINQITDVEQDRDAYEPEPTVEICKINGRFRVNRDQRTRSAPNSRSNSRARDNYSARNRFASNDRRNTRETKSLSERKEANDRAEKTKANLCIHCTTNNDSQVAIYHPSGSGFGGHGSCCIYDVNGDINGQKARRLIQEIIESNEATYVADQNMFMIDNDQQAFDEEDSRENI